MEHRQINKMEDKGKKGLATFLFSRIFIFGLMVALQLVMFLMLAYNVSAVKYLNYATMFLQFFLVIYIVNDKSDPTMKLIWVIFIMFMPALGTLMYLYFRLQPGSIILKKRLENIDLRSERYLKPDQNLYNELQIQDKQVSMLAKYVYDYTGCPVYRNTNVTYFNCGEEKYKALVEKLEEAQDFIFMEYFIIEEGRVWNSILRILEKKVQQLTKCVKKYWFLKAIFQ